MAAVSEVLRLANGEIAEWQNGQYASSRQGEWHQMGSILVDDPEQTPEERHHAGGDWQIGVVALADGSWLANPPGWGAWHPRFPTREAALRHAVSRIVLRARYRRRLPKGSVHALWLRLSPEAERTVIAWAYRVLGKPAPRVWQAPAVEERPAREPGQLGLFGEDAA